jgi:hypothetical protein
MTRLSINASAALALGLMAAAGGLCPDTAHAYTARGSMDCGAGWDLCMQACDTTVPGGPLLGRCNDYCARGTSICEASRIPLPAGYRSHPRYATGRK